MTYNPNVPQAGTKIKNTYNLLTTNFSEANRIFGINHYPFNDGNPALQGKHKFVSMVEQSAGGPATAANEMALFTGDSGGVTELFLKREGSPPSSIQMTCRNITPAFAANQGNTFLPGGFILKWGFITAVVGTPVVFTTPFPTVCHGVSISNSNTGAAPGAFVTASNVAVSGFTAASSSGASTRFFWIAIGN